eukprot:gene18685-20572_t
MGSSSSKSSASDQEDNRSTALVLYDRRAAQQAARHDTSDFTAPQDLVHHLRPGDLVQKKGTMILQWFYTHFAVFIGNGEIVHATGTDQFKGEIVREDMVKAFSGEDVRKNNHMDGNFTPRPWQDVVRTARAYVGQDWNYNLFAHNCEHFASMCRYGRKISLQSLAISDVKDGDLTFAEYLGYYFKSVKENHFAFVSWVRRKAVTYFPYLFGPSTAEAIGY